MERTVNGKRVVIISHDVVGEQMAGPGIRYYNLARTLGREFDVLLAIPDEADFNDGGNAFAVASYRRQDWASLKPLVEGASVVLFPSDIASDFPQLDQCGAHLVVDGYDPLLAEWLALYRHLAPQDVAPRWAIRMEQLHQQSLIGDFFVCASERQRDWWLGILEASGRINPYTFGEDPSLRRLIDVVPFGLPEEPPKASRPVVKGVWPGIGPADKVILWGGGLWPWLDPLTAIRAVARVHRQRPDVRLIFPGTKHPNPWLEGIPTHNEAARRLAQELDLLDEAVFFGDWVPYADWPAVLLESDIALTLHHDTLETRLAFRSRMLDYIWAGLPTIATRGDATSDLVERYQLGTVVDYEDDVGVAEAILELLERPPGAWEQQFEQARKELTWDQAARPLIQFCRHPRRAPDKEALGERLGNPYYVEQIVHLRTLVERYEALVEGYERGRFIRLMRWLHRMGRTLRGG